ncbi:iron chaperone [Streptomyces specialis]|uniref:iron chaperone n=1 Tax=Streptomyces specialis TaxID=498367 RepID=UPI00073EE334|nr:DUF1801 domain-containing protein [Streptomyces specialis]
MSDTEFTAEEKAAMKERAREVKSARRGSKTDPEADVLAKIAEMEPGDRALGERIHALVRAAAPGLTPKLWYGMPAYAKDGKVLCFFQCSAKFKARYSTLGFSDQANLDEGAMWATSYALTGDLTADDKARLTELVRRAAR